MVRTSTSPKAAFFDLDFTLVNLNSSYAFILYYLVARKDARKLFKFFLFRVLSIIGLTKILGEERLLYFKFLRSESKSDIEKISKHFVDQKLIRYINSQALEILQSYKKQGYQTVLISASLEPIARTFADRLKFDRYFASTLSYKNGICQGTLADDLTEKKQHKWLELERSFGRSINPQNCYFLSDNHEDLELMKKIPSSQAVVYDTFQARYWKDHAINQNFIAPNNSPLRFYFFLPSTYYFRTRKPLRDLMLVHMPFFLSIFLLGFARLPGPLWPLFFIISWLGYIAVYEVGYFINDYVALKFESSPTLNFDPKTASFVKFYIPVRIAFLAIALELISRVNGLETSIYLVGITTTSAVFLLHNFLPRQLRLVTFPALKLSHLLVPLLIFPLVDFWAVIITTTLFSLGKEMIYYYRKVRGLGEWSSQLKAQFVVLPKLTLLAALLLAGLVNPTLFSLFWLGASLSLIELGFVGKQVLILVKKDR